MWYEKTDQPCLARSWNLSDDLGQIEYVFSDKTGTLTQNAMVFRNCSIGGKVYQGKTEEDQGLQNTKDENGVNVRQSGTSSATGSTTVPGSSSSNAADEKPPESQDAPSAQLAPNVLAHFHNADLAQDLADAVHAEAGTEAVTHACTLNSFFSVLSLCHTVLAAIDPETGAIEYQAQSPDEAVLVQAAADAGFVFHIPWKG